MRRKGRLLQSSILVTALFMVAVPAFAAEPAPGDACSTLNYIIETGGPETSGVHSLLRCDGTVWKQEMTIGADGMMTLGNTRIGSGSQDDVNFQGDEYGNSIVTAPFSMGRVDLNLDRSDNTGSTAFSVDGSVKENISVLTFHAKSALRLSGDITPAQITANQNNYNPTDLATASVLRLSSNASRNITSLAGGADGRILTVMNVGSFPIVLKNDDGATGTAANRFALTGDLTLAAKQSAILMYDSTASRWRQIANGTATGSGDNLGNHTATQNIALGTNWLSGDGGNEGVRIDSDGNVGIGASVPSATLDVVSSAPGNIGDIYPAKFSGDTLQGVTVAITNADASHHQAQITFQNKWFMGNSFNANTTDDFYIYNAATSSAPFVIGTDDNVGIGTTSPATNLTVYSSGANGPALTVATSGDGDNQQAVIDLLTLSNGADTLGDGTSKGWQIWANADGSTNFDPIGGANTFGIGFANGAGWSPAALQILSNGNVGIGTHDAGKVPEATLDAAGSFALSGDISPAQITANKNNYNPTDLDMASVLRLTSDASRNITSIAGGVDGRILTIMNIGSFPIVLKNDDGSTGTAANRFALTGDVTLAAKETAILMYDSTASRWRQISKGSATGTGDNLGNHTATQNIILGSYYLSGDGGNEGIAIDSSGRVGVNGTPAASTTLSAYNTATTGTVYGSYGETASTGNDASGVYGYASATSGVNIGVYGRNHSSGSSATGVFGYADATTGETIGVYGRNDSTSDDAAGVYGYASATSGVNSGVFGKNHSSGYGATGVVGYADATTGITNGVYGRNDSRSDDATAVFGNATATSGATNGIYGKSASSTNGATGVYGYASATTGQTNGVYGIVDSTSGWGVYGRSTASSGSFTYGVRGEVESTTGGIGVSGYAGSSTGSTYGTSGWSESTSGYGVYGWAAASSGTTYGVYGGSNSTGGYGVYAQNSRTTGYGLYCNSGNTNGCGGNRAWYNSSDMRLKDHIADLEPKSGLDAIVRLRPVRYQWKDTASSKRPELGFLAQDVEKVYPELVSVGPDQKITMPDGKTQVIDHALTMSYSQMVVPLVKAVQELKAENDDLRARLEKLESKGGQKAQNSNAQGGNVPANPPPPPAATAGGRALSHHRMGRDLRSR